MSFGAPYLLWALALLPPLVFLFLGNERRRQALLQKIVAPRLLAQLAGSGSPGRRRLRFAILLSGIAAVIVSMAQPQYGYTWEQSKRRGRDVLIAIDTSKSMLSTDVAPNRLARAKLAAQDLIMQLQGDRVGVLAFAGDAFLQAPLTVDYGAALDSIGDLDTNTIPRGGTDIASVIDEAAKAFGKGESEDRALILFTDGEELDADGVAVARNQQGNFRIFTVGVGTAEGSIIPVSSDDGGTSFVKDPDGQIVKSKIDENRLKEIAAATDGFYTHLQNGPEDMKKIAQEGLGKMKEHDIDARMSRHPIERYQWPLALGLALITASLFISERRREKWKVKVKVESGMARATLVMLIAIAGAHTARALPPNQGIELYNDKKYKESQESFNEQLSRNPDSQALEFDSGAAAYKTGEFDKAIENFGKASTAQEPAVREKAEYNLGNALCLRGAKQEEKESKLKDWNNALQHYDEALKINPKNGDAKFNRDVVAKLIEQLNQKPPPQSQQDKKDQNDKDQKKQDSKDQKQDQKNQQDKQDQKKDRQDQKKNDQNSSGGKDQQQDSKDGGKPQDNQQQQQQSKDGGQQQKPSSDQNKQDGKQGNDQSQSSGQQQDKKDSDQQNKQDSKDGGKSQDNQQQQQSKDGGQQQQPSSDQNKQDDKQGNDQSQSPQPTPSPSDEPDKKISGQLQAQQSKPGEDAQNAQAEAPYVPGQERQMTHDEAARVVEAEKDEEAKGVLNEHKASAPVLKDW